MTAGLLLLARTSLDDGLAFGACQLQGWMTCLTFPLVTAGLWDLPVSVLMTAGLCFGTILLGPKVGVS